MSGVLDKLTILELKVGKLLESLATEQALSQKLSSELEGLRSTFVEMETKTRNLSDETAQLKTENLSLKELVADAESRLEISIRQREQLAEEKTALFNQREEQERILTQMKEDLAQMPTVESTEPDSRLLKEQISSEKERYGKLFLEYENLRNELNAKNDSILALQEKVSFLLKELEDIPEEDDETEGEESEQEEEVMDSDEDKNVDEWQDLDEVGEEPEETDGEVMENKVPLAVEGETVPETSDSKVRQSKPARKRHLSDDEAEIPLFRLDNDGNETDISPDRRKKSSEDDLI